MRALALLSLASVVIAVPAFAHRISPANPSHSVEHALPHLRPDDFPSFDSVVIAAGLRPLSDSPLPPGQRELRIWFGGGIAWPQDMFRLQIRGGSVKGEWIRYWSSKVDQDDPPEQALFSASVRYHLEGRCEASRSLGSIEICIARFSKTPDWRALLQKIESEGVWTLPDSKDLPREVLPNGMQMIISDGYSMTVEARDGKGYRSYGYNNPEYHKQDEAKHAAAISAAFDPIWKLIAPNSNTRIFRGRYTPAPKYYRFVNCGDTTTWGLYLTSTPPPLPRSTANDSLSDTLRSAYAEVRGTRAYRGYGKVWDSPYPEIIEADTVLVIKPWRPEECR